MSDAEYTAYVRGKMWERSHEHIVEERRRREEERKRKKLDEEEGRRWQRGVEEALRRGEERRKRNRWKGVWEGYLQGWGKLCPAGFGEGTAGGSWKDVIVWPVESGKWEDVEREQVERFFRHAPGGVAELGDLLKKERVRWHPDKMQQRAGSGGIGVETLKLVTAVFQVVDRLWSETKNRA